MHSAPEGYYSGLGASVCAAILGEDKNKSPYDLWREFTDPESRPDLSDNEAVEAGIELEPAIAQWGAKKLELRVDYLPGRLIRHPRLAFMQCHPDAMVIGENAGLEVKNRGLQTMRTYADLADFEEDMDRAQATEVLQCHASMAVCDASHWYLAVAIGGQRLLTFKIRRDDDIINVIEGKYREFWGYVERREPPPPINVSDCNKLWPSHRSGSFVEADDVIAAAVEERKSLKAQIKDAEQRLEFTELRLKSFMRDSEELRVGGHRAVTWKNQQRAEYIVAAKTIRVFR